MSRGERYAGESGRAYFEWQTHLGRLGATLDRWKFLPHVSSDDAVVDFGCGGGWLLASLPASRRIGIDVNPCDRDIEGPLPAVDKFIKWLNDLYAPPSSQA